MGKRSYLPTTLSGFNNFCREFANTIKTDPANYGLTADDATEYAALQTAFETAYDTSISPMTRTPYIITTVGTLRKELTTMTRSLVDVCQAAPTMTDAKRRALGITIRKSPSTHPVPATYPLIEVRSLRRNTVKFNLRDIEQRTGRVRKPEGVKGAMIYTFLGDNPPANESDWNRWGTVSKATCELTMAESAPFGTVLWIAAAWLNTRLESGPIGDPVSVRLGSGVVQTVDGETAAVETV